MLPKLTVHNVPMDFDVPVSNVDAADIADASAQRNLMKDSIWQTIVEKKRGYKITCSTRLLS